MTAHPSRRSRNASGSSCSVRSAVQPKLLEPGALGLAVHPPPNLVRGRRPRPYPPPVLAATFDLADGRRLCFDDVGDPDGRRSCCTSTARRTPAGPGIPTTAVAAGVGVRLIAVDRPGAGGQRSRTPTGRSARSPTTPPRSPITSASPSGRCSAWSAGSLFGLAVAARHPALVDRVRDRGRPAAVRRLRRRRACSTAPATTGGRSPSSAPRCRPADVAEMLAPMVAPWPCDLELAREHVLEGADDVRRAELDAVPGALDAMAARGRRRRRRTASAGWPATSRCRCTAPDIDLADVRCPVHLWYGGRATRPAPPSFGRWLADHLPDADARRRRRRRPLPAAAPLGRDLATAALSAAADAPTPRWPSGGPGGSAPSGRRRARRGRAARHRRGRRGHAGRRAQRQLQALDAAGRRRRASRPPPPSSGPPRTAAM